MSASSKDISVVAKAAREILIQKSSGFINVSSYVSDEELKSWAKYFIDTLDWHRATEEPKAPKVAIAKDKK